MRLKPTAASRLASLAARVCGLAATRWNLFIDHLIEEASLLKSKLVRQLYQNIVAQHQT